MSEMEIDSIRVSLENYQRVVILKQKEGEKYLLIWIGTHEAEAIAVRLQDVQVPRPLTHDLLFNTIKELGGTIEKITISGLENDTYFASIGVRMGEKSIDIDSRPSDALAIAVRAGVPIFAEEAVMEKAGLLMDKETGEAIVGTEGRSSAQSSARQEYRAPVGKEEMKKLSAFQDFIESMDMGGIGGDEGESGRK